MQDWCTDKTLWSLAALERVLRSLRQQHCSVFWQMHAIPKVVLDKLEEALARIRAAVVCKHPVSWCVVAGSGRPVHDAVEAGPKIGHIGEELARLVVDILPATRNVAIHQNRDVVHQRLRRYSWRRVVNLRNENKAALFHVVEVLSLVDERRLGDLAVAAGREVALYRAREVRGGYQHPRHVALAAENVQRLLNHRPVLAVAGPTDALGVRRGPKRPCRGICKVVLLRDVERAWVKLGIVEIGLRHQNCLDMRWEMLFGVPHHVQESRKRAKEVVLVQPRRERVVGVHRVVFKAADTHEQDVIPILFVQPPLFRGIPRGSKGGAY
eukprot:m.265192 g.265192  ORF g.265192 m.265192 type:complete len:325 (+) comp26743_c0_seq1:2352-3326(+)